MYAVEEDRLRGGAGDFIDVERVRVGDVHHVVDGDPVDADRVVIDLAARDRDVGRAQVRQVAGIGAVMVDVEIDVREEAQGVERVAGTVLEALDGFLVDDGQAAVFGDEAAIGRRRGARVLDVDGVKLNGFGWCRIRAGFLRHGREGPEQDDDPDGCLCGEFHTPVSAIATHSQ